VVGHVGSKRLKHLPQPPCLSRCSCRAADRLCGNSAPTEASEPVREVGLKYESEELERGA
jgi:hypothetical protein